MQAILFELIKKCATDLPADVEQALVRAGEQEKADSPAAQCLAAILENIALAREKSLPLCQDTGVPLFHVWMPDGKPDKEIRLSIRAAVREATARSFLRPNCVETLSNINSGDNTGADFPPVKRHPSADGRLRIGLLLKGGGSENVSAQFKLPEPQWAAQRDLEGVRRIVLQAVHQAQGRGCAPGIIGVGIGGDRELSWTAAKKQLFRRLDDANARAELQAFEEHLLGDINRLGIGPMGTGGRTTALAVKAGTADRHPACYFVSIAYLCWAARRYMIEIKADGTYEYV